MDLHTAPGDTANEALLARMTVEEKIGQLNLYAPADAAPLNNPQAWQQGIDEQLADIRAGRLMGLFNGAGVARKRVMQKIAVEESRLGIPLLFGADVIHGFRTIFPVPLAEAASWEPALAERTARAAAVEAAADGFRWNFAPMVDIARDPRWGRGVEGAGEDVRLGTAFAVARVRGFQGDDLARGDAMLATPKHFAAYGAGEGGLDYNTVDLSERTLREVYLPPFEAALKAGALCVMTAFNEIAGIPCTANPELLLDVLRGRWRFMGFTVSDYTSEEELIAHGFAADRREATKLAFLAGTDVSMQSGLYQRFLPGLVASGEVPMDRLDDAVRRVLYAKRRLGLFDDPYRGLNADDSAPIPRLDEHRALAREAGRRSLVLLKNEGDALPLKRGQRIALIGPFAEDTQNLYGPWTIFPAGPPPVSLAEGLREALGADAGRLSIVPGCGVDAPVEGGVDAAVAAAKTADIVLLAIGEPAGYSGEARSRTHTTVPAAQQALVEAVSAACSARGTPVVVLLRNGRALALEGAVREAHAILVTWFLGHEMGRAVADVLIGDHAPSGRLPISFPQVSGQAPCHYARKPTGRPSPAEAPDTDYKARYVEATHEPLYAFGHGLTYGRVDYSDLRITPEQVPWGATVQVRATLTNTGARAVEEVAQLYVRDPVASITRPLRELKGFRKLTLAPGAQEEVVFELTPDDLSFIGRTLVPTVEPGVFEVWVAPSATAGLHGRFKLLRAV